VGKSAGFLNVAAGTVRTRDEHWSFNG